MGVFGLMQLIVIDKCQDLNILFVIPCGQTLRSVKHSITCHEGTEGE
jgi:hypothetical protein